MSFVDVQNQLYNAMIQGLQQTPERFQILQPSPPLSAGQGDAPLWNLFNNIPPRSLNHNYTASGGNQLFSDYKAVLDALKPGSTVDVKKDIGAENFKNFTDYVAKMKPLPPFSKYSEIFLSWAMQNAPDVAQIGAADYASIALDPILSAQMSALTYTTGKRSADWSRGYKAMAKDLANAPSFGFTVDSTSTSRDVSHTWAEGQHSGLFGLWGGSSSSDQYSEKFAESRFRVDASFKHLLTFQTNAGAWYESAALGLAFHNHGDPPWRPGHLVTWENTFGAKGNLQRVTANLLIADTMKIEVSASTSFSQQEQQTILNNQNSGMWPFYTSGGSTGVTTQVKFDDRGGITITTSSAADIPVVIAANVLQIDDFVGFTVPALESRVPSLV